MIVIFISCVSSLRTIGCVSVNRITIICIWLGVSCILCICIIAIIVAWRSAASGQAVLFTAAMVIVQFALALATPGIITFYSNCAVFSEWKTGIDCTGTIMGLTGVPIKLSLTIVGILVPAVLAGAGYIAGEAITETVKTSLINSFALIPLALFVFSLLLVTFLYKLTQEKLDGYAEEIAQRRAEQS